MTKRNWALILTASLILALVSCKKNGNETATGVGPETVSTPAPTPIDQATAGEVTGKITFEGARPKPQRINMNQDPTCEQKQHGPVFAEDGSVNDDGSLSNAFVYVKAGAEKLAFALSPAAAVVLDQNGCMYKPHVLGITWRARFCKLLPRTTRRTTSTPCRRTIANGTCRKRPAPLPSSRNSCIPKS